MLKTKMRQFRYNLKNLFSRAQLVMMLVVVAVLVWTYGAVSSMTKNWELEQALVSKQHELKVLQLEVDTMRLENEYYASDEYQELSARAHQNKKLEGETLVYLSENSEAAKHKHDADKVATADVTPSNFSQWLSFLFGT